MSVYTQFIEFAHNSGQQIFDPTQFSRPIDILTVNALLKTPENENEKTDADRQKDSLHAALLEQLDKDKRSLIVMLRATTTTGAITFPLDPATRNQTTAKIASVFRDFTADLRRDLIAATSPMDEKDPQKKLQLVDTAIKNYLFNLLLKAGYLNDEMTHYLNAIVHLHKETDSIQLEKAMDQRATTDTKGLHSAIIVKDDKLDYNFLKMQTYFNIFGPDKMREYLQDLLDNNPKFPEFTRVLQKSKTPVNDEVDKILSTLMAKLEVKAIKFEVRDKPSAARNTSAGISQSSTSTNKMASTPHSSNSNISSSLKTSLKNSANNISSGASQIKSSTAKVIDAIISALPSPNLSKLKKQITSKFKTSSNVKKPEENFNPFANDPFGNTTKTDNPLYKGEKENTNPLYKDKDKDKDETPRRRK